MADPKITFKLELDDGQLNGQLNSIVQKISQLNKGQNISVHVNADISGAQSGMKTVETDLNKLNGAPATVEVGANISAEQSGVKTVETDMNTLDGRPAATVEVTADVSAAQTGIDQIKTGLDELDGKNATVNINTNTNGSGTSDSSSTSSDSSSSSSGNGFFSSVGSFVKTIFKEGSEYETSRAKAATLMPEGVDMEAWDKTVSELSAKYGQSGSGYNEAAYSMLSAGKSFEELPELLDLASQLAVGGFTDVPTAAGLMAMMGNAYGSTDYKRMANNALLTQNYGIIDVGPMARVMPQVNSVAANAGVSMENLNATMAAITHAGVQPEQAGTQVRALINELDKTGQTGQKTLASATGVEGATISKLMEEGWTMGDIARSIGDYSEKTGMTYADMFSSQEAGAAIANILSSDNGGTFDSAYQDMVNGVDAVTPAFETMADTTNFTMEQIMTQFQNAGVELFTALAPALSQFLEVLTSDDFKESLNTVITTLTNWLASDGLNNFINAIITASEWLLDTFNSGKSIGEIIGELFSKAITVAIPLITQVLVELAKSLGSALMEAIVEAMPQGLKDFFGIYEDTPSLTLVPKESSTGAEGGGGVAGSGAGRNGESSLPSPDYINSWWEKKYNSGGTTNGVGAGRTTTSVNTNGLTGAAEQVSGAMDTAAGSMGTAAKQAGTAASNATKVSGALGRLASAVSSAIRRCNKVGTGGSTDGSKSVGMSYVPFDGYVATLHKGEAVLTAAQASTYRMGGGTSVSGIDYTALASAMSGMTMTMDSRTVGRIVEKSVSQAQGARVARSMRGVKS